MATFQLEVVSATRMVWEGHAERLIARTTEGDIGIMANHEPLLASLVPWAAEALAEDGRAEIFLVDGGFLSVAGNRVSLLSQYVQLGHEISLDEAEHELAAVKRIVDAGDADDEILHRYHRAKAQEAAARRYREANGE
ncbi:F0F1 ATP synthase subunit epsilon [Propionicicella superfundia]|uniref:F0F1 ATP synthase subunit epsilon n=1 Tax=Propionicicella superfundia TaxID=348582 RepID=UPI00040F8DA6|nr:F0F1 ATP synthase subunit epsilon [Propionicicella superfundia]